MENREWNLIVGFLKNKKIREIPQYLSLLLFETFTYSIFTPKIFTKINLDFYMMYNYTVYSDNAILNKI